VASAILVELNIRLTVLVVETARLERRGVNDTQLLLTLGHLNFLVLATFLSQNPKNLNF
jgi:hypothetical protein